MQSKFRVPRTAKQFYAMSPEAQDTWDRVSHVISKMRAERVSLRKASHIYGLSPHTVKKLGGSALRRRSNGRYAARPSDRRLRVLIMVTLEGKIEVVLRSSRVASEAAKYGAAVDRYLQTGEASRLREFEGKYIVDASGQRVPFITDLKTLDRLGNAGVLSFESLYAKVG